VGLMVRLVDDLLDISRITKGKLRLTKEKVDLRVVVDRAGESARPFMVARKHDFSVSLATKPIWVAADKGDPEWQAKIKSIFKAMSDDGTLKAISLKWIGSDISARQ